MLSWFILAPLAILVLLNIATAPMRRRAFLLILAAALLQAAAVFTIHADVWQRSFGYDRLLTLNLHAGSLGRVMLLSIALVLAAAAMVGQATILDQRRRGHFASVLLIALMGMNGAVLMTDLFSLYVFLEATSIASFVLIAFDRDQRGLEGALKYLLLSTVASVLMIGSVAILLLLAGGTSFARIAEAVGDSPDAVVARIAVGAFVCGLFIKGGLVPFHGWVLGAYSASPGAASVFLAGIVTKVSGIYALVRLAVSVFPFSASLQQVLMLVGVVSILVGALAALGQTDMKRLLAYSSISQMGYIVLGLGCWTPLGIAGAVFHLFNHSVFKSLLFVNVAALEQRLKTTDMNRMGGLGSRMPITAVTSVIASLSTAGIPPFAGFWSKVIIVVALWQGQHYTYAALAILLSVATLAYFLLLQRKVFFGTVRPELECTRESSWELAVPAIALAAVTTAAGLLFPKLWGTFLLPGGGY